MTERHENHEENLHCLIAAGFSRDARPGESVRQQTNKKLIAALRDVPHSELYHFPGPILLGLAVVVTFCAGLALGSMLTAGPAAAPIGPVVLIAIVLCANLAAVPLGGAAIVISGRRKRHV